MTEATGIGQFLKYLKQLPSSCFQTLYESPATCVAILRYLPSMEKQFIMRMVLIEQPLSSVIIQSWCGSNDQSDVQAILTTLRSLHILLESDDTICLVPAFRRGLKQALLCGKLSGLEEVTVEEKHRKTSKDLYNYGIERWECILKYMALPSVETQKAVSQENRQILNAAGFINVQRCSEIPEITSDGFKFLLTDRISQLWIYLLNYLKHIEENEAEKLGLNLPGGSENNEPFRHKIAMSIVEPLNFLFHLSFCTLGKAYSSKNLSDQMEDFLQQLREVGIVYQRKRKSGWFYPTPLAIGLCSSCATNDLQSGKVSSGFLVVETNYRVYAYTDSLLQLAIVSTFTDMIYRFGNLSVGILTRESVRRALQVGITSKQIVDYLKSNSHDIALNNPNPVPPVICDQLRLWELERDRFQFDEGALYSNFVSEVEFDKFRNIAKAQNVLLWENIDNRLMVIRKEGTDIMKQMWALHKS